MPCSRTQHGLTRVGLEPPTSGSGVRGINHQLTALPQRGKGGVDNYLRMLITAYVWYAHKVAKRNATKTPLKPRLRISIFQLSPGNRLLKTEQSGVCLINKGASQFEERRICEAERKRKERKARAKEPSSVSAQSEFTCSICNRQFRAKIGLYSHQRTHKHT